MTAEVTILGIPIHSLTIHEAQQLALGLIASSKPCMIMTPNAEIVYKAANDESVKNLLKQADLRIADGGGLIWAARLYETPLPERVTGIDLMIKLLGEAAKRNFRVFFLGAKPEIIEAAKTKAQERWPGLQVCGVHHGYFSPENEQLVIQTIRDAKPDLLFVGFGAPKQEEWMCKNRDVLDVPLMMGVGGSFDVLSGQLARAPTWMQRIGLEWLFRLIREPQRVKRIMVLPRFVGAVLRDKNNTGRHQ